MHTPYEDFEWKARWEERGQAVRRVLGETDPPGSVAPFSWRDYLLPGACAMTFKPAPSRNHYLYLTLGVTQPLWPVDTAYPWEFSVRTKQYARWAVDLLYQLVSQWLWEHGNIGVGYHLPLVFHTDSNGELWGAITDDHSQLNVVGSIRGLYLWTDSARMRFRTSSGTFGLLAVVPVTHDEDRLGQDTTPAHVILLLRRLGIEQLCNPFRSSAMTLPKALAEWAAISSRPHDDVLNELEGAFGQ